MSKYSIKADILPGHGYSSSALYRSVDTTKEKDAIVKDFKNNIAVYRIIVNGKQVWQGRKR